MEYSASRLFVRTSVAPAPVHAARSPYFVFRLLPLASSHSPARSEARAFTLLELLIVMSLIAVLASLTLVVGRSVTERSKVAQAKAEMAVLAAALEQYKQHYGDYPWTPDGVDGGLAIDGGAILFNALGGNVNPRTVKLPRKGRVFVDFDRFTLASRDEDDLPNSAEADDPTDIKINWFNDPWGQWYYYRYRRSANDTVWLSKGFLLYSHGPDEACNVGDKEQPSTPFRTGLLDRFPPGTDEINRDNIYYGRD